MAESGSSYSKWWQQSSKAACGISGQCMALVSLGFCSSLSSLSFVGGGVGIRWPEAGVGICRDEGEGETRERREEENYVFYEGVQFVFKTELDTIALGTGRLFSHHQRCSIDSSNPKFWFWCKF